MKKLFLAVVLIAAPAFARGGSHHSGGSHLNSSQKQAANSALKELRKLKVATGVGLNFEKYNDRLIEAAASIEESMASIPQGTVKKNIQASLQAYKDAQAVWGESIKDDYISIYLNNVEGFFIKYKVLDYYKQNGIKRLDKNSIDTFSDSQHSTLYHFDYVTLPLNLIWAEGTNRLQQASADLAAGKR